MLGANLEFPLLQQLANARHALIGVFAQFGRVVNRQIRDTDRQAEQDDYLSLCLPCGIRVCSLMVTLSIRSPQASRRIS